MITRSRRDSEPPRFRKLYEQLGLDASYRMAVVIVTGSTTATVVGYYSTYASAAVVRDNNPGSTIVPNFDHPDFPKVQAPGAELAAEWYDPASADVWWR